MAWTAVVTETFNRANSGPVSTPGNTTGVGNGWIDVTGSVGSIVSDQLNVLSYCPAGRIVFNPSPNQ